MTWSYTGNDIICTCPELNLDTVLFMIKIYLLPELLTTGKGESRRWRYFLFSLRQSQKVEHCAFRTSRIAKNFRDLNLDF